MATLDELSTALRNADAAGDADAARMLAGEIVKLRAAPTVGTGEDMARGGLAGAVQGTAGIVGLGGDIAQGMVSSLEPGGVLARAAEQQGVKVPQARQEMLSAMPSFLRRYHETPGPVVGTSKDVAGVIDRAAGAPISQYDPKTVMGQGAKTVGSFLPAALAGPGGIGRRVVTQAVVPGVASETAGQATKGTAAEPWARLGAALAAPMAVSGAGRVITPVRASPERAAMVQTLADEGVTSLTAGQRTGNKALQYAESILGDAPMAGQGASRIQQEGQRQFTRAAAARADETGRLADAGPEALRQNYQRHDQNFRDLSARNTLHVDQQFGRDITRVAQEYIDTVGTVRGGGWNPGVQRQMQNIVETAQANGGVLPGNTYQAIRSKAGKNAKAIAGRDPDAAEAYRGIRNALDDAMERSMSPADAALWRQTRREYGAQKDLAKSVSRAGEASAEGQVVPANLRNTIAANNRDAYSRGQGPFHDLARAGSAVMAPLPNSGTGQRTAIHGLASGALASGGAAAFGPAGLAAAATPAVLGRLLMSRPAQAYLGNNSRLGQAIRGPDQNRMNRALAALLRAQSSQAPAIQGR